MKHEYKDWILYTVLPFAMLIGGFIFSIIITQIIITAAYGNTINATDVLHDFMMIF